MENHIILIEKVPSAENPCQDFSIIFGTPVRIISKGPIRITANRKAALLIITTSEPIPYSSKKLFYGIIDPTSTTMVLNKNCLMKILKMLIPTLTILRGPSKLLEAEGFSPQKSLHRFKPQLLSQLSRLGEKSQ